MNTLTLICWVISIYFLLAFVIPAIIVPNLFLYKTKTKVTSKKLKDKIKQLNKIKDDEKFIKAVFLYVAKRYKIAHNPITFILNLPRLFWHNPNKIIERENEIAYCHVQDLMIKTILLESKRFKESDIKRKITFSMVIHQHLQVMVNGKKVNLDPWGYNEGVPYGKYLSTYTYFKYRKNRNLKIKPQ
ncbi:MAG: hypothetical protein KJ600_06465 [Nanoarchaeota archaeon]|nr:hypothetical protein [Nanoarchaeota archaeon]MBU1104168.1 hypothetical protein [Nanoarchaeota archaeon]